MIDASDLTTDEVRSQYVLPLVHEILQKSGLTDQSAVLGFDVASSPSTSAGTDVPSQTLAASNHVVNTLFQEIALMEYQQAGAATSASATQRCYAEVSTSIKLLFLISFIVCTYIFVCSPSHEILLRHSYLKKLQCYAPT